MKTSRVLCYSAALMLFAGCRSSDRVNQAVAPTSEVKAVAVENNASYVTEVSFKKGLKAVETAMCNIRAFLHFES